jgi:hypothetical protein
MERGKLTVATQDDGAGSPIKVGVRDEVREVKAGEQYTFAMRTAHVSSDLRDDQDVEAEQRVGHQDSPRPA